MATAGLQVFGTHGVSQIDSNFINMVFAASGVINFNNNYGPYVPQTVSFTGEAPVIFLRNTQLWVYPCGITRNGNTWTWKFYAIRDGNRPNPSLDAGVESVPYYIFDRQPNVETRVGLNIYTPAGRVAFNSDYKPMRLAAVIPNNWRFDPRNSNNDSPPMSVGIGGGNYACALPCPGIAFGALYPEYDAGYCYMQGFRLTNGNTFQTNRNYTTTNNWSGAMGGGVALVVDLSRLG